MKDTKLSVSELLGKKQAHTEKNTATLTEILLQHTDKNYSFYTFSSVIYNM